MKLTPQRRAARMCLGILLLLTSLAATAADVQILRGHLPPALNNLKAARPMPGTNELDLVIGLPLRNREALETLLNEIYDPTSTNFHRYLTPTEFAERFGPAPDDYQTVIAFAEANGMQIVGTHPNRTLLDVRASVSVIEKTLHVGMRLYQHPKEARTFYAPDKDPSLNLSVKILSIGGLDDFSPPKPMDLRATPLDLSPSPSVNPLVAGSGPRGFLVGQDFRSAYAPGVSLNGAGQSVGLFQLTGYYPSDITSYETLAGIPHVPLVNVLLNGFNGRPNDSNIEVALDICMTIAMAPGLSSVIVYQGRIPNDILNRMATDNLAKQLSSSWTWSGFGGEETTEQILMQFAAQGQSYFQASGDDGAHCGLIRTPSDDPFVTVVGGTIVSTSQPDGALLSETTWPFSGGGVSTNYAIPGYQKGVNMSLNGGSTTMRNLPDVSCVAQDMWIVANNGEQFTISGTSAAAPLWAGFAALANQQAAAQGKPVIGFINPAIYAIASSPQYGSAFHDITTGNNTNDCSAGQFFATPGYDLCTGLGTPNGSNLISLLVAPIDALQITPASGITFSGPVGGPFQPAVASYSLLNAGTAPLNWTIANTSAVFHVSPTSGTLPSNGSATAVTVSLETVASNLAAGIFSATLRFTNANNTFGQSRQLTLAIVTAPTISDQPDDQPVFDGATATFTVGMPTNALLFYQWRYDNGVFLTNLNNGGNIFGANTASLIISNATSANVGLYSVLISNVMGSITSSNAALSILPSQPVFIQQPAGQTALPGQTISLNAMVAGTKPIFYHWRKDGADLSNGGNLSGALTTSLTLSNVTATNAGTYSLVASNEFSSATSTNALLMVTPITAAGATLTTLYSFGGGFDGGHPNGLLQATSGLLYGTTQRGGTNYSGTVFQYAPGTTPLTLYAFNGTNDGANPFATLAEGPDGNFYGTAYQGGAFDNGTVFRVSLSGILTNLFSLNVNVGDLPYGGLVFGADASLYGTTYQGGAGGRGTAFKITTNGVLTVLYAFTNGLDGGHVAAGLALAEDGSFYGTTYKGGVSNNGAIYRVSSNGLVTTLAAFSKTNGAFPYAALVQGADGNLYGTTSQGGTPGFGNIFRVSRAGQITNLYAFTNGVDGSFPTAGLLLAGDGNFYGVTAYGGTYGAGTVFRFAPDGTMTPLAQFTGFNGANPQATLAQGADGNLYGTTQNGGASDEGVLFQVGFTGAPQITIPPASQSVFAGDTAGFSVVVIGAHPLAYQWLKNGTNLPNGGTVTGTNTRTPTFNSITVADQGSYSVIVSNSFGAVTSAIASLIVTSSPPFFVLQPTNQTVAPGANVTFTTKVLGNLPLAFQWRKNAVALTNGGNVSGATSQILTLQSATEGNNGTYTLVATSALSSVTSTGAVLTVIPPSAPGTRLTTLYSFTGGVNGRVPNGLVQGTNGDLYGTTQFGGSHLVGTAFKITTNGPLTFLASLDDMNGTQPRAALALGSDGNLYGTASTGGVIGAGSVFRMLPNGTLTNLHSFTDELDGGTPTAALVPGSDGKFYGTAQTGGSLGYGNTFQIDTNGDLTTLYSFTNGIDGGSPSGGLVAASDGNFYGMTPNGALGFGNVYRMTPGGALANLYTFKGGSDGYQPAGTLVQGTDGAFYGTTTRNSISGFQFYGTIFRLTSAGVLSTLYAFNGFVSTDGAYPQTGLLLANDGCFYGTTYLGGSSSVGTIFRIGPDGAFTTLASFDGFNDGSRPQAALIQGADGSLYGTTTTGGYGGQGTIFRLSFTGAPQIISSPASQTVFTGAKVIFGVAVSGAPQLYYQWRLNGTNITDGGNIFGTASRVLTLNNVMTANAGTYSVLVSNSLNSTTSSDATLTVNSAPPAITRQPTNQTAMPGSTVTIAVTATGNLPLAYQWRFNRSNLSGATNNALVLPNVQYGNAGNYSVLITNNLGSITSVTVGLRVPALLAVSKQTNSLVLTWLPPYVLQSSTNVVGPYADIPGATSPLTILITSAPQMYYRLRAPTAATVAAGGMNPSNQFTISVAGLAGYRYIVQGSTNLTSWQTIQTNPAPFIFFDPNAALLPRRFYRTQFVP